MIQDFDDAISYSQRTMRVDRDKVYVVGISSGEYTACLNCLTTKHRVDTTFAWGGVTDLEAWYHEFVIRKASYSSGILAVVGGKPGSLDVEEVRSRSQMYVSLPKGESLSIRLFVGIKDGYRGRVPISYSLRFYNRLAAA